MHQLTHDLNCDFPDWSYDGQWITYSSKSDTFIIPANGSTEPLNLTNHPAKDGHATWPANCGLGGSQD